MTNLYHFRVFPEGSLDPADTVHYLRIGGEWFTYERMVYVETEEAR